MGRWVAAGGAGIATDFMAGVLLSKLIEGGLHYGLGSTLAVRREALTKAGGLRALVDHLADDYEMGARVAKAGYRVAVCGEVVETGFRLTLEDFIDHQLRWARDGKGCATGRLPGTDGDVRIRVVALESGGERVEPGEFVAAGLSFFLRLAQAMTVGAEVLGITRCFRACGCCRCATWWRWGFGWRGLRGIRLCGAGSGLC